MQQPHETTSAVDAASSDSLRSRIRAALGQVGEAETRSARGRRLPSIPGLEIQGEIHRGGQGFVYRALQLSTNREVAVKVLRDGGPADRQRFEREVHALAHFKHANIVSIHDRGEADGQFYIVMDLIDGCSLDAYVTAQRVAAALRQVMPRRELRIIVQWLEGVVTR